VRRLALVVGVLALPLLPVSPASAATNVICVNSVDPSCTPGQSKATIPLAITAANANVVDDLILVGPGTYNDGPYTLNGSAHAVTLRGAGATTVLTLPASATQQLYLDAVDATVQDLTVLMTGNALGDYGLLLQNGSSGDHIDVDGSAADQGVAVWLKDSTLTHSSGLTAPGTGARGLRSDGGNTISDCSFSGQYGYTLSTNGIGDTASRISVRADVFGVWLDSGNLNLDDAVIDLGTGTGAIGLDANNPNPGSVPKSINANHVTIVGGGAGSVGVQALATWPTVQQTSTITLTNAIVRGPATSLRAAATNDGTPGANSVASITTSYSDWHSQDGVVGAHGSGGVISGPGHLDVDPGFVSASDFHLAAGSPVTDKGDPAGGGPATDRDGAQRVQDGDVTLGAVRDMGAYERPGIAHDTTAPDTKLGKKPGKRITTHKVKLTFSSEAGATFQCQVDGKAWKACSSPLKVKVHKLGKHVVLVRAVDAAGNVDASPAKVKFKLVPKKG
jgi:hypothetical protein